MLAPTFLPDVKMPGSPAAKIAKMKTFKRPKNHEDSSDLDAFWTKFDRVDEIYHFEKFSAPVSRKCGAIINPYALILDS